jgi:hypothetical protein
MEGGSLLILSSRHPHYSSRRLNGERSEERSDFAQEMGRVGISFKLPTRDRLYFDWNLLVLYAVIHINYHESRK